MIVVRRPVGTKRSHSGRSRPRWWIASFCTVATHLVALGSLAPVASAQEAENRSGPLRAVSHETEEYLRTLQVAGLASTYPTALRPLSPTQLEQLSIADHPWRERFELIRGAEGGAELFLLELDARSVYNSAFPIPRQDGPVWSGRGVTLALDGGIAFRYGPLSVRAEPIMFWSQNASFDLAPSPIASNPYADPRRGEAIDYPQRFGNTPLTRLEPGQSTARIDVLGVTAGISTANQVWGPAQRFPLILGRSAPGFLHGFAGTWAPWDLWIGNVHGRLVWGRLEQSDYSPMPASSAHRFMAGLVGTFSPRGLQGLEIGVERFFHTPWPSTGLRPYHLLKPFETFAKLDFDREGNEVFDAVATNQLAAVFARWVFPAAGLEVYGAFAREDNSHNTRDIILEPDHNSGYLAGFQKVWGDQDRLWTARGETMRASASHLGRARRQEPFYVHGTTRQGHTHRGQILGSAEAYGGGGSFMALDRIDSGGRITLKLEQALRGDRRSYMLEGVADSKAIDVLYSIGGEVLRFSSPVDWTVGGDVFYNLNRHHEDDVVNFQLRFGGSTQPRRLLGRE